MRYTSVFVHMRIFEHVMIPGKVAPLTTLLAWFRADKCSAEVRTESVTTPLGINWHPPLRMHRRRMARPTGLEPVAPRLEGVFSIR